MYKKFQLILPTLLFIIFVPMLYFSFFPNINNFIHDNFLVSPRPANDNIIIVAIDERSLNEIGLPPWPRFFMAEAVSILAEAGAAAIGVAVTYDTVGPVPEYDEALINAARGTDRLVLGAIGNVSLFQRSDAHLLEIDYLALPFGELGEIATAGFLNLPPDEDGVTRHALTAFRYGDITARSLPFEVYRTFRRATGQEPIYSSNIPLDNNGQFPVRFVGRPGSFNTVSFWGVINEHYPAAMFKDSIVLIGVYAHGLETTFTTSIERALPTFGIEIYANIVQNFMEGIFVTEAAWWLNILVLVFCAFITILLFRNVKPLISLAVSVALVVILFIGARLAYDHFHVIIGIGGTVLFLIACYLSNLTLNILTAQYDKQHIRNLFGRFVAPEVVNEIISGGVDIQLGGVVKEITALFVDIRGFTAFSEANTPEVVVEMVNRYLALTSSSIQKNSGTIDKFIGDATMALFNAPNNVPNHPLCAVRAAWAMKQGATALQKEIIEKYGVDLQFGVGINTGVAVVGNMGSDFRMDYTAIGDTINTASRLEGSAGKGQIIISDATYQQVQEYIEVEELGAIALKNKSEKILIYSVINIKEGEIV